VTAARAFPAAKLPDYRTLTQSASPEVRKLADTAHLEGLLLAIRTLGDERDEAWKRWERRTRGWRWLLWAAFNVGGADFKRHQILNEAIGHLLHLGGPLVAEHAAPEARA
jgi:hypothetical protein